MQQSSGTVTVTVGLPVINGKNTKFLTEAAVGKFVYIYGLNQAFTIAAVSDDGVLNITQLPVGRAGQAIGGLIYAIVDHFSPMIGLPLPTPHQINAQDRSINRSLILIDREIPE